MTDYNYSYLYGLSSDDEEKVERAVRLWKSARKNGLSNDAAQNLRDKARSLVEEAVDWQSRQRFENNGA